MLHVISARCVARDLHTVAPWPLQRTYWRQFAVQWGYCENLKLRLWMWLLLLLLSKGNEMCHRKRKYLYHQSFKIRIQHPPRIDPVYIIGASDLLCMLFWLYVCVSWSQCFNFRTLFTTFFIDSFTSRRQECIVIVCLIYVCVYSVAAFDVWCPKQKKYIGVYIWKYNILLSLKKHRLLVVQAWKCSVTFNAFKQLT